MIYQHMWLVNTAERVFRWVLKEAAYKSISSRFHVGWKDLQVNHLPSGQPTIKYTPDPKTKTSTSNAMTRTRSSQSDVGMESHIDLMCTLSHDAGVVVGVVIAQTTVM